MVFIRKKDPGAPLAVLILVLIVIATLALVGAAWMLIDVQGDLMSPIKDGRRAGLPIAVFVAPLGALGIAITGFLVWMAIQIARPSGGPSAARRRDKRLR